MKTYMKFAALVVVIIGVLVWLAMGGISESKTYYKTIAELGQMGDQAKGKRLRVGGDVQQGSIVCNNAEVSFVLVQTEGTGAKQLKVLYNGIDPLPDTFKDGAQALADGKLGPDGVFQANKIQAKCASKYEVKPALKKDGNRAGM